MNLDDTDEMVEDSDSVINKKKMKKNHFCQICNKAFRDTFRLKRHEKVHIKTGELPEPEISDFSLQEAKLIKETLENDPPIHTDIEFDQKNVLPLLSEEPWSDALNIVKQENPWDVTSIFDFAYFNCPECDYKHQDKQDFVSHASNNHPWVSFWKFN